MRLVKIAMFFLLPVEVCPRIDPPENGYISTDIVTYGTYVTISCVAGYNLLPGQRYVEVYCSDDGVWSKDTNYHCTGMTSNAEHVEFVKVRAAPLGLPSFWQLCTIRSGLFFQEFVTTLLQI